MCQQGEVVVVEIEKGLKKHSETFEALKTLTGYNQISEAVMRLGNLLDSEGYLGRGFGIGLGFLGTVMGLESESSPM